MAWLDGTGVDDKALIFKKIYWYVSRFEPKHLGVQLMQVGLNVVCQIYNVKTHFYISIKMGFLYQNQCSRFTDHEPLAVMRAWFEQLVRVDHTCYFLHHLTFGVTSQIISIPILQEKSDNSLAELGVTQPPTERRRIQSYVSGAIQTNPTNLEVNYMREEPNCPME